MNIIQKNLKTSKQFWVLLCESILQCLADGFFTRIWMILCENVEADSACMIVMAFLV